MPTLLPTQTESQIGGGALYIRLAGTSDAFRPLGEASAANITTEENTARLGNFQTPGGGSVESLSLIQSIILEITGHSFSAYNMAIATYGEAAVLSSASVVDEEQTIASGGFIPADAGSNLSAVTLASKDGTNASDWAATTTYAVGDYVVPTVANTYYYKCTTAGDSDAAEPGTWPTTAGGTVDDGTAVWTCVGLITLVEGTDYEVSYNGLRVAASPTNVDQDGVVLFSYTHQDTIEVNAILNSGKEYEIAYDGFNSGDEDAPVSYRFFRAKSFPAGNSLISAEEFASMAIRLEVLKDSSRVGAGVSQYYTYRKA